MQPLHNIIRTLDELRKFSAKVGKVFSFDTETTGLDIQKLSIVGISIYDGILPPTFIEFNFEADVMRKEADPDSKRKKREVWYRYRHKTGINYQEAYDTIADIFDGAEITCHNAKYDWKVAKKYGFSNFKLKHDTMIMSYLLDVNSPNGLKDNARKYLGRTVTELSEVIDMANPDWFAVDWDAYGKYACDDAYNTEMLKKFFLPLMENKKLMQTYYELEMPIIIPVAKAEMSGIGIDKEVLYELSDEMHKDLESQEQKIYEAAGVEFNIGSNKQLAEVLFDRLGCPVIGKTKTGQRQVDENTLKELAYRGYEIADEIISFNKIEKMLNTYVDKIPTLVDAESKLHGSFNQTGARTGRFSSSNPNLQNQPKSDKRVRKAFVADKGKKLIVLDWSTIEVRIMAHESKDRVLSDLLWRGADLHQATADRVGKIAGIILTRQQGKTLNFAILYGMGGDKLAYTLNAELKKKVKKGEMTLKEYSQQAITKEQADRIIQGYYSAYSGFASWSKAEIERVVKNDYYVRTLGGRIRQITELRHKNEYHSGCRIVVNTKIQGGAGDLMKLCIRKLDEVFGEGGKYAYMEVDLLLMVHDEYVLQAPDRYAKKVYKIVAEIMRNIFPNCTVPIECDGGIYDNWAKIGKNYLKNNSKEIILWQRQQKNRASKRRQVA
jgi:DNA polymerase-1